MNYKIQKFKKKCKSTSQTGLEPISTFVTRKSSTIKLLTLYGQPNSNRYKSFGRRVDSPIILWPLFFVRDKYNLLLYNISLIAYSFIKLLLACFLIFPCHIIALTIFTFSNTSAKIRNCNF